MLLLFSTLIYISCEISGAMSSIPRLVVVHPIGTDSPLLLLLLKEICNILFKVIGAVR